MERLSKIYLLAFCVILCFSCGGNGETDPDPSAQEEAFEKLSGTWTLGTNSEGAIIVDGIDASLNYPNFGLSFADGTYQTQNAGSLFSASGTWAWVDQEARQIQLDGSQIITLDELTEARFRFSFIREGGVAFGVGGSYSITVIK